MAQVLAAESIQAEAKLVRLFNDYLDRLYRVTSFRDTTTVYRIYYDKKFKEYRDCLESSDLVHNQKTCYQNRLELVYEFRFKPIENDWLCAVQKLAGLAPQYGNKFRLGEISKYIMHHRDELTNLRRKVVNRHMGQVLAGFTDAATKAHIMKHPHPGMIEAGICSAIESIGSPEVNFIHANIIEQSCH